MFSTQPIQTMMIRILFIWSMRHPASAYVQGINDLAAPIALVFLVAAVEKNLQRLESEKAKDEVEAKEDGPDSFSLASLNSNEKKTSLYKSLSVDEIL